MRRVPIDSASSGSLSDRGAVAATVRIERRTIAVVVHVAGDLDMLGVAKFEESISVALRTCPRILVIDLSGVTRLPTAAVEVLVGSDIAGAEHTSMRVVTGDAKTYWPQTVVGLDRYLNTYPTLDAALRP